MNILQNMIKDASQKYHTDGKTEWQDGEFDAMLEEELHQNHDTIFSDIGNGYDIAEDTTYGNKVPHRYGLIGSLPKCRTYKEFLTTFRNVEIDSLVASTKLDGLSVVLYFEKGKLAQAVTRGDGHEGIDITDKIRYITHIENLVGCNADCGIRGEIIMSNANFEKFKKLHPEAKNSRNSVAGLINNKEITSDLDLVDVIFYTLIGSEDIRVNTYNEVLQLLNIYLSNQKIVKYKTIQLSSIQDDKSLDGIMKDLKDEWYGDYPYDGIVLASSKLDIQSDYINYISNAYKFKAESKETEVVGFDWNLSKTGYLIPRINFKPIQLSGATVQFCTGHNALNIQRLNINIGSRIKVTRANEVIPYLEEVITEGSEPYILPHVCPSCGSTLVMNGVHLQCPNRDCKNTDIQDTLIWMNNIVPVEGLGDILKLKYLSELLGEDNISIENIYKHGPIPDIESKYVKEKLFNETFNRLFTDNIKLESAILALNIPRFGDITAAKLARFSKDIKAIYVEGFTSDTSKLQSIGNANYQSLLDNESKLKRLNLIKDQIMWDSISSVRYKGNVCITGKLSVKRSIFEELLKSAGYTPVNSVKKDTKYLITDDPNSGSSKNKLADKHGIPKLTEIEFRERFL